MKTIIIKTEYMVRNIKYESINFGVISSLALSQLDFSNLDRNSTSDYVVSVNIDYIYDFLEYESKSTNSLRNSLRDLIARNVKENLITIKDNKHEIEAAFLFTKYKISTKNNSITLNIGNSFKNCIAYDSVNNKGESIHNRYIVYDIEMFRGCKNAYALKLYELFKLFSYKKDKLYNITFNELKQYLDISLPSAKNSKKLGYNDYIVFRRSLLMPALDYINANTDLIVTLVQEESHFEERTLKGKEKKVHIADRLYFKIDTVVREEYCNASIQELALTLKKDMIDVDKRITKATESLRKNYGIDINKNQVAVLTNRCKDLNLVRFALVDASRNKDVKDIGAVAYSIIDRVVKSGTAKQYIENMKKKYNVDSSKTTKKSKKIFELDSVDKQDKGLVRVYNQYLELKGSITEKDIAEMKLALVNHYPFQICTAIRSVLLSSNADKCKAFKYIAAMLKKNMYGDIISYNKWLEGRLSSMSIQETEAITADVSEELQYKTADEYIADTKDGEIDFNILQQLLRR